MRAAANNIAIIRNGAQSETRTSSIICCVWPDTAANPEKVRADLCKPGLPREKVIAAVIRLMEMTLARVGNPEYERENKSFGVTTLKNRHVRITGGRIELDFLAKSNVRHHSVVSDRKLARILRNCRDLPGAELFQYLDEEGRRHSVDSADVNDYLRAASGEDITAKDFRTWAGTNLAFIAFCGLENEPPTRKSQTEVVRAVARQLGNSVAICRKCYIHPAVLNGYLDGSLQLAPTMSRSSAIIRKSGSRSAKYFAYFAGRSARPKFSMSPGLVWERNLVFEPKILMNRTDFRAADPLVFTSISSEQQGTEV